MKNVANDIMEALQPLVAQGKVRLLETSRGVTIEINDSILFRPVRHACSRIDQRHAGHRRRCWRPPIFRLLSKAIPTMSPIATPQFPSNWELSAMRATTVLRLFNDGGVGAERLTAIGYGETRPVETNTIGGGAGTQPAGQYPD
jgi:chemotaxis protein MotB